MTKKHFILPLILLTSQASQTRSHHWMSDMMCEIQESFERMHKMMEEAFEHTHDDATKSPSGPTYTTQTTDEQLNITFKDVASGDVQAQFDDNMLNVKHPRFILKITQVKNRYNQPFISLEVRSEHTEQSTDDHEQDEEKPTFYSSAVSAHVETIPVNKPVQVDEPDISYDEDSKELIISLPFKNGKQIPVTVKRSGTPDKE